MKVALIKFLKSAQKYGIEELVHKTNCEELGWRMSDLEMFTFFSLAVTIIISLCFSPGKTKNNCFKIFAMQLLNISDIVNKIFRKINERYLFVYCEISYIS